MAEKKVITGVEAKEEARHPEVTLANSVSIMDYAKKKGFVINYEDEKSARIQDVLTDGEIIVNKLDNSWRVKDEKGWQRGHTIRFVERMEKIHWPIVIDKLVEERNTYLSYEEYNKEFAKEFSYEIKEKDLEKKEVHIDSGSKDEKPVITKQDIAAKPSYSKEQLAEIIAGTKRGLEIKVYDNVQLSHKQMHELRIGLENGINLSKFALEKVSPEYIREVRMAAQDGLDIKPFALKKRECVYAAEQVKEIRLGMKNGLSKEQMKIFMKPELNNDVMRELRIGLQDGLEMKNFGSGNYLAKDIHTVRVHLMTKQFIETLKDKLAVLFEQVRMAIKERLRKQSPELPKQEITAETDFEIEGIVKGLYENIEESISDKSVSEKKEILAGVFQKVVAIGNAIEQIYPEDEKATSIDKAVEKVNDNITEQRMKESALETLKEDYTEKFNQSEYNYNVSMAELTQQVMEEPLLTAEQKKELLNETFTKQFSEEVLDTLVKYLPASVMPENDVAIQQEIIEYFEDFELEQ